MGAVEEPSVAEHKYLFRNRGILMPHFQYTRQLVVRSKSDNSKISCRLSQRTFNLEVDVSVPEAIPADDKNALGAAVWPEHASCALRELRVGIKLRLTVLRRGRPNEDAPGDPRELKAAADSPWQRIVWELAPVN